MMRKGDLVQVTGLKAYDRRLGLIIERHEGAFGKVHVDVQLVEGVDPPTGRMRGRGPIVRMREADVEMVRPGAGWI